MQQKMSREKRNGYLLLSAAAAALMALALFFFWEFSGEIRQKGLESCRDQQKIVSVQAAESIRLRLDQSLMLLKSVASTLPVESGLHSPEMLLSLQRVLNSCEFFSFGVADREGNAMLSSGGELWVGDKEYFHQALQGQEVISQVMESQVGSGSVFMMSIPLQDRAGRLVGVLYGVYDVAQLAQEVQDSNISDRGYIHICAADGTMIMTSISQSSVFGQGNLWENLEKSTMEEGVTVEQIQQNMAQGKSDFIGYQLENQERYAYYTPIGVNDWYAFSVIKREDAYHLVHVLERLAIQLNLRLVVIFSMLVLLILYFTTKSSRQLRQIDQELLASDECFKVAVSKTKDIIFEYRSFHHKLIIRHPGKYPELLPVGSVCSPHQLVENGLIDHDSVSAWEMAFQAVEAGGENFSCVLCLQGGQDQIAWGKLTISSVPERDHGNRRWVGIIEDITDQKTQEQLYRKEREYRKFALATSSHTYEINLTQDKIIRAIDGETWHNEYNRISYSKMYAHFISHVVAPEDRERMASLLSIQSLTTLYREGKNSLRTEYRHHTSGDNYQWMEYSLRILRDDSSRDLIAYILIRNIDERKRRELELRYQAQRDPLTGLYNRRTTLEWVEQYLKAGCPEGMFHALMILDLDNFKQVNDTLGHAEGDHVLLDVAQGMEECFRSSDIKGRLGGDEFVIFLKGVPDEETVLQLGAKIAQRLDRMYGEGKQKVQVTISLGVALMPTHGSTFQELYDKADKALYRAKNQGKNQCVIYHPSLSGPEPGKRGGSSEDTSDT